MSCTLVFGSLDLTTGPYDALVGTSMGSWKSIQTSTSSLFLDGSAVTGDASDNREIVLLVEVEAETRQALTAACEALIGEANKPSNTLTWTHDGAVPIVYDTFRVQSPERDDDEGEGWLRRTYSLTIPALPFARSNTRRTPSASFPPGTGGMVTVVDWPTTTQTGVSAQTFNSAISDFRGVPLKNAAGSYLVNATADSAFGGITAVSNCSITSTLTSRNVVSSASGLAVAKSSSTVATSSNAVIVGLAFDAAASANIVVQVGVEWFNGGTSLLVDWGTPAYKGDNRPVWAASSRPSAATAFGYRMRVTATAGLQTIRVTRVIAEAETFASVVADGGPNYKSINAGQTPPYGDPASSWTYLRPSSPVNASTQTHLQVQLYRDIWNSSIAGVNVTVKLHSAGGKWSAWYYRPDTGENIAFPEATASTKFFNLTAPDVVADVGGAVLTAVDAVSVEVIGLMGASSDDSNTGFRLGSVVAGLAEGVAPPSVRGVVYILDSILGSARSPAAVHAHSTTPLTDIVVQAVDPLDGPALLSLTGETGTAAAPATYDGVYSIVGTRTTASAPATPTMVVTQKHAGSTVSSVTLTGITRPGNHYVDFGTTPLPLVAIPDENVSVSYTFTLSPSGNWGEELVMNVNSPMMMLEQISPARKHVWIDEPEIVTGIGKVFVGTTGRTDAAAPMQPPILSLPFTVQAPSRSLLVYSTAAGSNVELSYLDHYLVEPS